jgi:hypothetical protein
MDTKTSPNAQELQALPVMTPRQILDHFAQKKDKGEAPARVLMETSDLIGMLEAVGGFKLTQRLLQTYSSPKLKLVPPPIQKNGHKACYVFPDHFDRLGVILTLRQGYHLPLKAIQQLLEHFPAEANHLIMERKLSIEELLDLAKMLPKGYGVNDLIMAKTCDLMVQDALSSNRALSAATEAGDALKKLEEKTILARLDELKVWVSSGRRQEFVRRESAEDFKNLAQKHLIGRKISRKITARRARLSRGK